MLSSLHQLLSGAVTTVSGGNCLFPYLPVTVTGRDQSWSCIFLSTANNNQVIAFDHHGQFQLAVFPCS